MYGIGLFSFIRKEGGEPSARGNTLTGQSEKGDNQMSKLINIYQEKFTVIPQEVFIDPRLDFRSRGVLATIVSLPSGWDFSIEGLSRIVAESERGEGRDAVKTSVQFLEKLGYLSRVRTQDEKGHFSGYDYQVNIPPLTD